MGPVLVVLAGFLIRTAYYDKNYGHPDETLTVEVVGHMRGSGDWDTNWAKAPGLESALRYDQYNFSSHLYATYFFYRAIKWVPGLEAWRSRNNGFWVYRFFVALLATVVVWQTWELGRRVAGDSAGLAAGALVAVVPLLVQDAHYLRPEAWVTALTMAAVMVGWPGERYRPGRVLGAALLLGGSLACKFSLLALAWLPLVPAVAAGWSGW
ncbi:MAG: glycosyltransferase family 39 protein, partial [Undibacterium sp.]|nr:glycosyltransferase family 39 protein [Opitutaceae bacterium]